MTALSSTAPWPESDVLVHHFACPACKGLLQREVVGFACSSCTRIYPVQDGIPVLLPPRLDEAKLRQGIFFDDSVDVEWEIKRPVGAARLHRWLLEEKFRRAVLGFDPLLNGGTVLVVCGGSGMDAQFLEEAGARVVNLTSPSAPCVARVSEPAVPSLVSCPSSRTLNTCLSRTAPSTSSTYTTDSTTLTVPPVHWPKLHVLLRPQSQ